MKIKPLKDANFNLVKLKEQPKGTITPHCKKHGAMNKLTKEGIWRCVTTYRVINWKTDYIKDNNCLAGCKEDKRRCIK